MTSIRNTCFSRCKSLTSVQLPLQSISIGYFVFSESVIKTIIIPNTASGIYSFKGCKSISSIGISKSTDYCSYPHFQLEVVRY